MPTLADEAVITQKTRELCQSILEHPGFQEVRNRIDTFLGNESAKDDYQVLIEKSEYLHHKQHQGLPLTDEEVDAFEAQRKIVMENPITRDFIDAQKEMQKMQESVSQYVAKTFELGRLPQPEDLNSGSCGSGCGCH